MITCIEIFSEFDLQNKIKLIEDNMTLYGFNNKIKEMKERLACYQKHTYDELDI